MRNAAVFLADDCRYQMSDFVISECLQGFNSTLILNSLKLELNRTEKFIKSVQ